MWRLGVLKQKIIECLSSTHEGAFPQNHNMNSVPKAAPKVHTFKPSAADQENSCNFKMFTDW